MDNRAIGVFDSGLGGLTTVRKLRELLPHEDIVFLGDTARLPYGSKDQEVIRGFARDDMHFLCSKDVKLLVAACGTVSSNIMDRDIALFEQHFIGILKPAAKAAAAATRNGRIGLMGTVATVASGAFRTAVLKADPSVSFFPKACPDFVPLVESGHVSPDDPLLLRAVREYAAPLIASGVDTVILGCTHYPLIKEAIGRCLPEEVVLIDSGAEEAARVARYLQKHDLLCSDGRTGSCSFYVTARPDEFSGSAALFLGEDVNDRITLLSEQDFYLQ